MSRFPKPAPASHIVVLAWKDGGRTAATLPRLAPECTCGPYRFTQDPHDRTVYNQV